MVCHIHSFTATDLDRLIGWFHIIEGDKSLDVVLADYALVAKIRSARADLQAGRE